MSTTGSSSATGGPGTGGTGSDPQDPVQAEIEAQAAATPDDPTTKREELEEGLMDEGISEAGRDIGQHIP